MTAASKGKWVWRFLIRKNVPYRKVGSLPLPEDRIVDDVVIKQPKRYDVSTIVPIDYMDTGALPLIKISPILSTMGNPNLATIAAIASLL